ncbi:MAG: extracellular solute-binding protein [Ruminococcaceae bacterium]|nr:extracellular solute-binding protein [Oscillospiraceae bacterium]
MKKTKLFSLLLAVLMLSSALASCANNDKESKDESKNPAVQNPDDSQETEGGYYSEVPVQDMNGYTLNIIGGMYEATEIDSVGNIEFIYIDEYVSDDFFAKMHNRFLTVGQKYDVKFNIVGSVNDDINDIVKQSIMGGTHDYSMAYCYIDKSNSMVAAGHLYNLYDLDLDLTQPYFDHFAESNLALNNKLYQLFSSISYSHYESACILFYNGHILENKQIESSPYDLWKEGKWTMDAMTKMTEQGSTDVNNDGKYTIGNDILGLTGQTLRYISPVLASDTNVIVWDSDNNTFKPNMTDETVMAIGKATRKLWLQTPCNSDSASGTDSTTLFKANKTLFSSDYLGQFRSIRDKEDNYGIIMWPGIEENMDLRVHLRNPTHLSVLSDITEQEKEYIPLIISALAAYSEDYITEDYKKIAVIAGGARDQESAEVISYVINNTAYDISAAFGLSVHHAWRESVLDGLFASRQKSLTREFNTEIEEVINTYFGE